MTSPIHNTSIGILAGGEGRRVNGQDKGLLNIQGQVLIRFGLQAIQRQLPSAPVLISANRNLSEYQKLGTVVTDQAGQQGPLAGIAALLTACESDYLMTLPCDCPRIPEQLFAKMAQSLLSKPAADVAVVHDGKRQQNAVLLIKKTALSQVQRQLASGQTAIYALLENINMTQVVFDDWPAHYWNANTLETIENLLTQ